MRVLIVGCGYVGGPTGMQLAQMGHEVFGLRRTDVARAQLELAGIKPLVGDISKLQDVERLPGPFDWVVNTVSSSRGGTDEYRQVYLDGTRHLLRWLASCKGLEKYVYTSSTSVYGQTDGSVVDELSPTEPATETSRILLETEALILQAARKQRFPGVILRASGIYGPDRGHLFQQFLQGEASIAGKGERWLNMVHRDDLVGAIIAALDRGRSGEVYNASDDEPVTELEFFRWLSETLGKPLPPLAGDAEKSKKRARTSKRISNAKLKKDLAYQFSYPSYREGYTAEIVRLGPKRN